MDVQVYLFPPIPLTTEGKSKQLSHGSDLSFKELLVEKEITTGEALSDEHHATNLESSYRVQLDELGEWNPTDSRVLSQLDLGETELLSNLTENSTGRIESSILEVNGRSAIDLSTIIKLGRSESLPKVEMIFTNNDRLLRREIWVKAEKLLTQVNHKTDVGKVSAELLELVKQFKEVQKKRIPFDLDQVNGGKTKEHKMWIDILQSFQRRDNGFIKQHYQRNTEVTNQDIIKWMEKAFENYGVNEKQPIHPLHSGTPLSRMEQYVIHLNNVQETKPLQQAFLREFQTILQSSKFIMKPNGSRQLSIMIKPEQLGEMRIRFVQMNGEMTVRILVSTQVAKEMLETNMNQLRHMFQPHQVTIERQELHVQHGQISREEGNGQWKEDGEARSNRPQKDGNRPSEDETELDFNELLKNLII